MAKNAKYLFVIFFLALLLRTYHLARFPVGFHVDEARLGWNAYSLLQTALDDRGHRLPLYYNTFGDFRPTGIFYLTIPSLLFFGKNEFAVRFPSALFGALTVLPLYFFVKEITPKNNLKIGLLKIEHLASFMLAISPWHISVSRASSEVVLSLFIALWGLYFFLKATRVNSGRLFLFSFLSLSLSYFFYHSVRLLAPLFIGVIIFFIFFKNPKTPSFKHSLSVLLFLTFLTILFALQPQARGRFAQVSIFNDLDVQYELSRMPFEEGPSRVFIARLFHNKPLTYTRRFLTEYSQYFSANFFIGSEAKPSRYTTIGLGVLTYTELILLLTGLVAISQKKASSLPLLLLLASPLPAALTTEDSPNLHRSFFMIIFISIIAAYGYQHLLNLKKTKPLFIIALPLFIILNSLFFIHMYTVHAKYQIASSRNYGNKELALQLITLQDNYDQIILTNIPDDPYPWLAFFGNYDPTNFNQAALTREHGVWTYQNFVFSAQRCPSQDAFTFPAVKRLLVVDARGCETESKLVNRADIKILSQIQEPNESIVYTLWSRIEE